MTKKQQTRKWDLQSHKNITQVIKTKHKLKLPKQHKNSNELEKKSDKESSNEVSKWPQKFG